MDINSISSSTGAMLRQQKVGDAVGIKVQSKAMDIQATQAAQLISSVAQPVQAESAGNGNQPSHLGQNINVKA